MIKKISVFAFFLQCFFTVVPSYAENLTLSDALKSAVKNNEIINAADKTKEYSSYMLKSAKGKMYPNLYVEGSVNRIDSPIVLELSDARKAVIGASAATLQATGASPEKVAGFKNKLEQSIPAFDMNFQDELFYKLEAVAVWPLYTGGKISANIKAKETESEISEIEYHRALNSTITSVVEGYFKAKLAGEVKQIRLDYLNDIKKHKENAYKMFKAGMISKANQLRAEVAFSQASTEYDKSARDEYLALVVLSNLTGKNVENAELTTKFNIIKKIRKVDSYITMANTDNISMKLLESKKKLLKQKTKAVKGNFLPAVAAFGKYEIYKDNLTLFEPEWVAGINAKLDIFSGFSDRNDYKAYSSQTEAVELYIRNTEKLIRTAVRKYHHEIVSAKQQYESLKRSEELAKENLKLYKQSFREGLATSIEVIDAEVALSKIRLEQSQALYDYNVSYAKLADLCGQSEMLMNNITGENIKNEK